MTHAEVLEIGARNWWFLTIGLTVTAAVGLISVRRILEILRERIRIPPVAESRAQQLAWEKLIEHPEESGRWVGVTERFVFFFGILFGSWEPIGIWLVFKMAAKWEAWSHLARVPDHLEGLDDLKVAVARRVWAAQSYCTLVVGTALNFLIAWLGVFTAEMLQVLCT
jgi:hypothetical protein